MTNTTDTEPLPYGVRVEHTDDMHRWCCLQIDESDWAMRMPHFAFVAEFRFRHREDAVAFRLRFIDNLKKTNLQ